MILLTLCLLAAAQSDDLAPLEERVGTLLGRDLYDEAAAAKQIIGDFKPAMTKDGYLAFARALFKKERYSSTAAG